MREAFLYGLHMINTDTYNSPNSYSPPSPVPSAPSMTGTATGFGTAPAPITPPPPNSGDASFQKPKKKFPLKYILTGLVTFLLVVGLGAGYWLTQQSQDVRQQAYDSGTNYCVSAPGGPTACAEGWTWQAEYWADLNGDGDHDDEGESLGPVCCPGSDIVSGEVCYPGSAQNSYSDREVQCGCGTNGGYLCKADGSGWETNCTSNLHACGSTYNGCSSSGECISLGYGSGSYCSGGKCYTSAGRYFDGCGGPNDCYNCWVYDDGHRECVDEPTSCGQKAICQTNTASPTPPASNPPASNPPPPGSSPTPPVGPQCLSIDISNENPVIGESVTFTCGNVASAAMYQFRVGSAASPSAMTTLAATGRVSEPFIVTDSGEWFAQCRICTGQDESTCQPYESIPQ